MREYSHELLKHLGGATNLETEEALHELSSQYLVSLKNIINDVLNSRNEVLSKNIKVNKNG